MNKFRKRVMKKVRQLEGIHNGAALFGDVKTMTKMLERLLPLYGRLERTAPKQGWK